MRRWQQPIGAVQSMMFRVVTSGQGPDGRVLMVVVAGCYFLLVGLPRIWGANIWPSLGVPSAPTLFFDTKVVTAGLECRRMGLDPLTDNPCDLEGRPLNYPRVWLMLRWLGLNQTHTDLLGIVFVVVFLAALLLLLGRITVGEGAILALALCSPAVMFGIERGNTDIVIFALMAAAVVVWRKGTAAGWVLSPVIVLFAAILKLFPVFGLLAYLAIRRRRAAMMALVCIGVFALYALTFAGDLAANARTTPQGQYYMFGVRILPSTVYHLVVAEDWETSAIVKQLIAVIPLIIGLPIVWLVGRRRLPPFDPGATGWRRLSFYMGALLYLGPFALGNSWDYRLVFTLLLFPQLFAWIQDRSPDPRGWLAATTTVTIVVMLWVGTLGVPLRTLDELATWATASLVVTLVAASIPPLRSIVSDIRREGGTQGSRDLASDVNP